MGDILTGEDGPPPRGVFKEGLTRVKNQACDSDLQLSSSHLWRCPSRAWISISQGLIEITLPFPSIQDTQKDLQELCASGAVQSALILIGLNWVQSPEN